ncbi:endo-1,4-beta-xylanase [Sphingomonas sp.]|uniref:endo-1,4-beta-xylanase n=1 Tax=Sphingomonas sp. TaxID=28214 RepID=UPI001B18E62C|nr:endo-1,4-beta-xylanase [Sphingomonas sp.]MBO9713433.1 endo-1,4-beta-xylanase [Sphingomonas sp.]
MVTRREMLAGAASLGAAALAAPVLAEDAAPGLDAIAKLRGLRFGSCVSWAPPGADRGSFANPAYAALLERDCGILVPENEFKWQALRPDARTFAFDRFSDMLDYADTHGMAMRGHTLFWAKTQYFPKWLLDYDFGATPVKEAERVLGQHIRIAGQNFGKRVVSFDVVNEIVDEKTGGLRESNVTKAIGGSEALLDFAFHTARAAAPGVQLVYNDYMSWEPGNDVHRAGVLKLLEGFRKRGVPCDALGLQSHIGIYGTGRADIMVSNQEGAWRKFLEAVTAMGYKLVITEMDVNDGPLPTDHAVRDQAVADYAKGYLDVTLSFPQVTDVLVWGMCDKYSWLQGFNKPRGDGELRRCSPYDAAFKAKPMVDAIGRALAAAPLRVSA